MLNQVKRINERDGIPGGEIRAALEASLKGKSCRRVLLIPPDTTRMHSGAGRITNEYYHLLNGHAEIDIMPALGTHVPMTEPECAAMFGDIPYERFIAHSWRTDTVKVGQAPASLVRELSEGAMDTPIAFEVNKRLLDPQYDLILSVGQVVPHEVVGMANYTKNILVGCGGSSIINASHYLGAIYGMERLMGKDFSPVRRLFDYAQETCLNALPLDYVLTVTTAKQGDIAIHGLFIGGGRRSFEEAVALSQKKNITLLDKPIEKAVVYLDGGEFNSTWLGNKAIYRTRMAIADGGELVIIGPGIKRFGEDGEIDKLIRKYGYTGRSNIIDCCRKHADLQQNLSAAAHLIHGSSDGRFSITYCPGHLTEEEVKGAGFGYIPLEEALARYRPEQLQDGYNTVDKEDVFYVSNPAVGLWADREKF